MFAKPAGEWRNHFGQHVLPTRPGETIDGAQTILNGDGQIGYAIEFLATALTGELRGRDQMERMQFLGTDDRQLGQYSRIDDERRPV